MKDRAVFQNASWIVGCKIVQSVLGLLVGMQTARYLGPDNYGLISYAASVAAFFVPVMQLGFRSTLVRELVVSPEKEGETLGTALFMNVISAGICVVGVWAFTSVANRGETDTVIVCTLYAANLVFQALEMIQYWFQAKLLSRYTAIISIASYIAASLYKIWLLISQKSVYWFAVSQVIDYAIIAIFLIIIYRLKGGQKLTFSLRRGKEMFRVSSYYIVSSLMVTIFANTDSIMLKLMQGESATGFYSAAVTCATCTSFVFGAVIDSVRPVCLESYQTSQAEFERNMKSLVSVVVWLALAQSVVFTLLSDTIVSILYGSAYQASAGALRVVTWYSAFSYLGAVRNVWVLAEEKHTYLWIINLSGALGNILLNAVLIPQLGINGAALASVLTQIFTNVMIGFLIPALRPYNRLLIGGASPKYLLSLIKGFLKRFRIGNMGG